MKISTTATLAPLLVTALMASPAFGQYSEDFESSATTPPEWSSFATPNFGVVSGTPFGALTSSRALWAQNNVNPLRLDVPLGVLAPGSQYTLTADLFTTVLYTGATPAGAFVGTVASVRRGSALVETVDFEADAIEVAHRSALGTTQLSGVSSVAHTFTAGPAGTGDFFTFAVNSNVIWIDNVRILPASGCATQPVRISRSDPGNRVQLSASRADLGGTLDVVLNLATAPAHTMGFVAFSGSSQTLPLANGRVLLIGAPFLVQNGFAVGADPFVRPVYFQFDLPNDPSLCGFVVHAQGAAFGTGLRFELSNAVDMTLGG